MLSELHYSINNIKWPEQGIYLLTTADMNAGNEGMEGGMEPGIIGEDGTKSETGFQVDSLLTSWPPVIGISAAAVVIGIILGFLLARRKIKKGIDIYDE